ncbi:MAG: aspartate aminotransferase family protein [bacterium]|nr:aspartate aminotransferase family protein [bacterium]
MRKSLSAMDVFENLQASDAVALELAHGNADLIKALKIAGIAGPYKVVDPWQLEDEKGEARINAGGYSAVPFGDRYPELIDFVVRYLRDGVSMGLPQQSASEWRGELEFRLIEKLRHFAPSHADSQIFFSNSGSEAIESAIKFTTNYRPNASYFINFTKAYHGKTTGALNLTPNPEYQQHLRHPAIDVVTLPYGDSEAFTREVKRLGVDKIAGVIFEPIQGEAGVIVPPAEFLRHVDEICKRHDIVTIADEIQTGLGRSGYWFASIEWGGMDPDIIALAKPLGGGLTATGATIARRKIFKKMLGGLHAKHQSNTFGGNSLAMAIGLKSLDIIEDEKLVERAQRLGKLGATRLDNIAQLAPGLITDTRAFGMLFAAQFAPVTPTKNIVYSPKKLNSEFTGLLALMMWHKAGVLANFSLNAHRSIRLTPALTMPDELFTDMFDRLEAAAVEHKTSWRMFMNTPSKTVIKLANFALFS